jgi:hypothetical protein
MAARRKQDGVDRIQLAWTRERPGTPVESIGLITRIWHAGKLLAGEQRRTLARLGIASMSSCGASRPWSST